MRELIDIIESISDEIRRDAELLEEKKKSKSKKSRKRKKAHRYPMMGFGYGSAVLGWGGEDCGDGGGE